MRTRICIAALGIGLGALLHAGCDENAMAPGTTTPPTTTDTVPPAGDPTNDTTAPPAADNTGINERDASGDTKTPIDQDENSADVKTTAEIRSRITGDSTMSVNARNVKIVTSQGKVTLRGPVDSVAEKDAIERIAVEVAGAGNVDNQIEVAVR